MSVTLITTRTTQAEMDERNPARRRTVTPEFFKSKRLLAKQLQGLPDSVDKERTVYWYIAQVEPSSGLLLAPDRCINITGGDCGPQVSPGNFPLHARLYFPWVYLPVQVPDSVDDINVTRLYAQVMVLMINQHLNWNMTVKQREKAIRKAGGVIMDNTAIAHTGANSPLFAMTEPEVKDRRPLRSRRHTKAPVHTTAMQVIRREDRQARTGRIDNTYDGKLQDKRTTTHQHLLPPTPLNYTNERIAAGFTDEEVLQSYDAPLYEAPTYDCQGEPLTHDAPAVPRGEALWAHLPEWDYVI